MLVLCLPLLTSPLAVFPAEADPGPGAWWEVEPEPENPSPYYDSILYSEIAPKLREIELNSKRVQVEVIGRSAGGRHLFLVTLSAPEAMGRLGRYRAIRATMLKDPEKAQEMIDELGDFKVPVFVNGSIHGHEYPGVDAVIRLIETLAYQDSEEVRAILDNVILLFNVVHNPDGRVLGIRENATGIDLNRDFIAQSQPETRAVVDILKAWNPLVTLDLHGFVDPMLIEPTPPPHNPNYEFDLYLRWAFDTALAMEAEVAAQTGLSTQIPFRDGTPTGWDSWVGYAPRSVPMYAMYHGSYGHTVETSIHSELGVDAHYAAVWGALKFVADHRGEMVRDQVEIFRRGALGLPQVPIPADLLDETPFEQYPEWTVQDFPAAYVIPAGQPFQQSSHQAARMVDFLLANGVEVEQATHPFAMDDVTYPRGTYVVWMDQPKRGLANTILDAGVDLSPLAALNFYSPPAAWSHPLLWGVSQVVMEDSIAVKTRTVNTADTPRGSLTGSSAGAYAYQPTSLTAYRVTNELIDRGVAVQRTTTAFDDTGRGFGPGTFIVPADRALATELRNRHGLDVFAIGGPPAGAVPMTKQRIAVFDDGGTRHALDVLGFDYDVVGMDDLNAGAIGSYDVFVNRDLWVGDLDPIGQQSMWLFLAFGGDYVGFTFNGAALPIALGFVLADGVFQPGNAIVKVDFGSPDEITAGYLPQDYAYVYNPAWLTVFDPGVVSSAEYASGDFVVSGFWPGWEASGAAGSTVVAHTSIGDSDMTMIGLDLTFLGHPENSFRLLANAIYSGLD